MVRASEGARPVTIDTGLGAYAPQTEGSVSQPDGADQSPNNSDTFSSTSDSQRPQHTRGHVPDGVNRGTGGINMRRVGATNGRTPALNFRAGMHQLQRGNFLRAQAEFQKLTDTDLSGVLTPNAADWPAAQETLGRVIDESSMSDTDKTRMREWLGNQTALDCMGRACVMPRELAARIENAAPDNIVEDRKDKLETPEQEMMFNIGHFVHNADRGNGQANDLAHRLAMHALNPEGGENFRVSPQEIRTAQQGFDRVAERITGAYGVDNGVGMRAAEAVFKAVNQEGAWPNGLGSFFSSPGEARSFLENVSGQLGGLGAYDIPGTDIGENKLGFGKDPFGVHHMHPFKVNGRTMGMLLHGKEHGSLPMDPRPGGARNFLALTRDLTVGGRTYEAGSVVDAYELITPEYKSLMAEADAIRSQPRYEELSFYQELEEIEGTFPRSDPQNADLWSFVDNSIAYAESNPAARHGDGPVRDGLDVAGMALAQTIDTFAFDVANVTNNSMQERGLDTEHQQFVFLDERPNPMPGDARRLNVGGQTFWVYAGGIER